MYRASEIRCKRGGILLYLPLELEPIGATEFNSSTEPSLDEVGYRHNYPRRSENHRLTIEMGFKLPCELLLKDMTKYIEATMVKRISLLLREDYYNDYLAEIAHIHQSSALTSLVLNVGRPTVPTRVRRNSKHDIIQRATVFSFHSSLPS